MTKDEALDLALKSLELNNSEWKSLADSGDCGFWRAEDQDHYKQTNEAITAIKQARSAPAPGYCQQCKQYSIEKPLPAAQRQWVGLTDDEVINVMPDDDTPISLGEAFSKFAELIEAKLKEKNT